MFALSLEVIPVISFGLSLTLLLGILSVICFLLVLSMLLSHG